LDERFATEHERTYGHRAESDPVEVVHIRVEGRVAAQVRTPAQVSNPETGDAASGMLRPAFFGPRHGLLPTRVVTRNQIDTKPCPGPLIVEEYDATTVVPPGWSIHREERNNLLIMDLAAA